MKLTTDYYPSGSVQANKWQHVAVVHGNGTVKLYLDGVEITNSSYRSGDSFSSIKVSNAPTVIGAYHSSGSTYTLHYEGDIDDVRIWNTARTSAQISANKDTEPLGNEANLVASYNFNSSTTNTVIDNTSVPSNGTLVGGVTRVLPSGVEGYMAEVISAADYYAFGSLMPMRNASTDDYRYGFNGMEKDDEVKGTGNSIAYEARIYDPRLGKFLSVDPWTDKYSWQTPYAYHRNSPIKSVDWKGYGDPIKFGGNLNLKMTFGSGSGIGFNFSATGSAQIGTGGSFGVSGKVDATASIYNAGLGTSTTFNKKRPQFDLTLASTLTIGGGNGKPLPQYTLNYNSKSGIPNTRLGSVTYGQMLTYNSALDKIYRQGIVGARIGPLSMSSNNDTENKPYFAMGTDEGFTGGIIFSTTFGGKMPLFEFGYQSFTGSNTVGDIVQGTHIRRQSAYDKSFNKASTFFRTGLGWGNSVGIINSYQLDAYTTGWLQDIIHKMPGNSGEHFEYNDIGKFDINLGN
ncbi:hypothetical protein KFE94_16760 [bacterium SCSIO 12643]|nr:hypothetical protein KFE94_16760 [bacterium SCSIO 12643]